MRPVAGVQVDVTGHVAFTPDVVARTHAALAAGGVMRDAGAAPSFWVLADPEGNEACVCTWQGRD